ncbi:MAG: hypothetical protein KC910_34530, partial [Candidatus Eremiobacteraeota bacterium]|nr:hypothetical protein [Candidatus Eremiobacteraeota bacterium]
TVNGTGGASPAIPITKNGGQALSRGDIQADQIVAVVFNDEGTNGRFELLASLGGGYNGSTFYGFESGKNSTGASNVGIGYQALLGKSTGSTGSSNTGIGYLAGNNLANGGSNVFCGYQAGYGVSAGLTGSTNVCLGSESGYNLSSGTSNVFCGYQAGYGLSTGITGSNNVIGGYKAGYNLKNGSYNVFQGYQCALGTASGVSGSRNVGLGYEALVGLTSGTDNIAIGRSAGAALTTGDYNVFIGSYAGDTLTGNSKLAIHSSGSSGATPLIYGEFDNRIIEFNAWQRLPDRSSHPSISTGEAFSYVKGTYFVVAYNDSGTTKYTYLDLTSGTWSYSTTAP